MSRIIFTALGSLGDLHPLIALGLEMRNRGHDVIFITLKHYCAKIESLGFEFHSLRPDYISLEDKEMISLMMDMEKGPKLWMDYLFGNLRDTYEDLIHIAQNADFIVTGEFVYAAQLVAEKLGIGWAFCALAPKSLISAYDPPPLTFLAKFPPLGVIVNRGVINLAKFITRSWGQQMHEFRQELGLSKMGNPLFEAKFSPYLVLALFSPVLGSPQPDWVENTTVTGFTFYDGNCEPGLVPELKKFLDSGSPPLVFTLGSAAVFCADDFYEVSVRAAIQLNRRAVLLIGKNPHPENLPESIVAFDYVPYSEIFPHACAIVHQGGIGTTAQALRAGRPTLIMPYSHDQPDNAQRVELLGTSRTIFRRQYLVSQVVNELRELLENKNYADKAGKIGRILQSEDGARVACNQIEHQLWHGSNKPELSGMVGRYGGLSVLKLK